MTYCNDATENTWQWGSLLNSLPTASHYYIAYSGGVDSHVLLHLLATQAQVEIKQKLIAIHIHHGLQAQADDWASHCLQTAEKLTIECRVIHVTATAAPGQSPEAAARQARYTALAKCLPEAGCLLTAHHLDDQAETVLLQLLRGAGPKGLAAMPITAEFAAGIHCRPLLSVSRAQLIAYAKQHQLKWIEDGSNADQKFDRNFIRQQVMPLLQSRWPQAATSLARSASNCFQHEILATTLAEIDYQKISDPLIGSIQISTLLQLSLARQANVIRHWISQQQLPLPNSKRLQTLLRQLASAAVDKNPCIRWPGAVVRRYRDEIFVAAENAISDDYNHMELLWDLQQPLTLPKSLGQLIASPIQDQGLRLPLGAKVYVRFRQGGERFQASGRNGSHPLKKYFQEWGVKPWLRDHIPLLFCGSELISVVGYAIANGWQAESLETGLQIKHVVHELVQDQPAY